MVLQEDREVFNDIKGFGLGLLYQILLIIFQCVVFVMFVLNLILQTSFLQVVVPIGLSISILVTTIDLVVCFKNCLKDKMWAFFLIDIWFFIRYTWLPIVLLVLYFIF